MKQLTRALLLLGLLAGIATAATAATCEIGVKGGLAIQDLGGDDVEGDDLESRTGFAGGAYFQADFNRNFGLRFEALYYMKGATADSADFEAAFKFDYIEVPALLVVHFPFSETGRVNVFGGPTFGLNVKSDLEASAGLASLTFDIGEAIADFEFGLTFGAGLSFEAGSVVLGVDGRYGFGLTTVIDSSADIDNDGIPDFGGDDIDVTNQGFAFMASVGIPLGAQ